MRVFLVLWTLLTLALIALSVWLSTPIFVGFSAVLLTGYFIGRISGSNEGKEIGWNLGYDLGYEHGEEDAQRATSLESRD